ncbi:MAG TPA: carbonic anhydrase [Verrucomicrobiae bacterium]|nr:carbonic anhydrase [Verrucomicrobiae bacterium]
MSHTAQAIALTCIDFRFRKALHEFFENELNLYAIDHKADGGGVKTIVEEGPIREWIFKNFDIAFTLHGVNRVILINHMDCGAYGGAKAFSSKEEEKRHHEVQLRHAVSTVRSKYPDKQVEAYLADIDEDQKVTFSKVI